MVSDKRNELIDIVRGLLMLFVVLGHCGAPFTNVIYSFHVPAFFILSGLLYKRRVTDLKSFKEVLIKRLKRLYLPYLSYTLFFTLTYNLFINANLYVTDFALCSYPDIPHTTVFSNVSLGELIGKALRSFFFSGGTQLCGALWFLRVLFIASIIIDAECLILRNNRRFNLIFCLINSVLGGIGLLLSLLNISLPLSIDVVLTIMIFYSAGFLLKESFIFFMDFFQNQKNLFTISALVLIGIFVFVIADYEDVNLGANKFSNFILLLISSFGGLLFTILLSILIKKSELLSKSFCKIGLNTIAIMGWHFLSFKIVNLLIIVLAGMSISYLGAFPVLNESFWACYTLFGILIPISLVVVRKRIVLCLNKIIRLNSSK